METITIQRQGNEWIVTSSIATSCHDSFYEADLYARALARKLNGTVVNLPDAPNTANS